MIYSTLLKKMQIKKTCGFLDSIKNKIQIKIQRMGAISVQIKSWMTLRIRSL
jgi:hypothetical protein